MGTFNFKCMYFGYEKGVASEFQWIFVALDIEICDIYFMEESQIAGRCSQCLCFMKFLWSGWTECILWVHLVFFPGEELHMSEQKISSMLTLFPNMSVL